MNDRKEERGFIGLLILIFIALVVAKYLWNWSIFDATASPQGQDTVSYGHHLWDTVWFYIRTPVVFFWDRIVVPILSVAWGSFQAFIEWARHPGSNMF